MDFHSSVSLLEGNNGCTWTPRRFPEGLPNYKPSLPTTSKWDDAQVSPFKPCFFVLTSTPNMCPTPHVTSCLWAFGALSSRTQLGVTCGFTTLNTTHSTNPQNDFLSPSPSLYTPKKKLIHFFPHWGGMIILVSHTTFRNLPPQKKKEKKSTAASVPTPNPALDRCPLPRGTGPCRRSRRSSASRRSPCRAAPVGRWCRRQPGRTNKVLPEIFSSPDHFNQPRSTYIQHAVFIAGGRD